MSALLFGYYDNHNTQAPAKMISVLELAKMAAKPRIGSKGSAPVFAPHDGQGKTKAVAKLAQFALLIIDHDNDNKTRHEIKAAYDFFNVQYLAFTTSSHTKADQRWKVVIPLAGAVDAATFERISKGVARSFDTDPAQARVQQIAYVPNKVANDALYDCINELSSDRELLDTSDLKHALMIEALVGWDELQNLKAEQHAKQSDAPIKLRTVTGDHAGIIGKIADAYSHDLRGVLEGKGYIKRGSDYLAPNSSSGIAGVRILMRDGKEVVYSHHSGASDPLSADNHNGHALDIVDVICALDHGGDFSAMIKKHAQDLDPDGQKQRQRDYMAAKSEQETLNAFSQACGEDNAFDLSMFSLRGSSAKMKAAMLEEKYILGRMAILGQSTVFYAKPNAGKTLLTIWLIVQSIQSGEINPEDVFYINADDNHRGLTYKLELAERYGFHMLAPGYNNFNAAHFGSYLKGLVAQDNARGKILILDTVKKFTDIMDKKVGSAFGENVRQFVAHGGSVIMLAHVNKHRDADNKVIFSGTSDLVDDADCAYTLDIVTEDSSKTRTVKFENFKSRGDVASEEVYKYCAADGTLYGDRLESITVVSDEEKQAAEKSARRQQRLEMNADAIEVIKECIREGINKKTELIAAVCERSGISKAKVNRPLKDHTGRSVAEFEFWHIVIGDKNAHQYALNYLV